MGCSSPPMIESVIKGKTLTFLRRALPFDLKAVAVTEVSYSLEETIETSGMELKPGIAGQLAEATQGYPFFDSAHWVLRMATGTTCLNKSRTARCRSPSPTCMIISTITKPNWKLSCRSGRRSARRKRPLARCACHILVCQKCDVSHQKLQWHLIFDLNLYSAGGGSHGEQSLPSKNRINLRQR